MVDSKDIFKGYKWDIVFPDDKNPLKFDYKGINESLLKVIQAPDKKWINLDKIGKPISEYTGTLTMTFEDSDDTLFNWIKQWKEAITQYPKRIVKIPKAVRKHIASSIRANPKLNDKQIRFIWGYLLMFHRQGGNVFAISEFSLPMEFSDNYPPANFDQSLLTIKYDVFEDK